MTIPTEADMATAREIAQQIMHACGGELKRLDEAAALVHRALAQARQCALEEAAKVCEDCYVVSLVIDKIRALIPSDAIGAIQRILEEP